MRQVASKPSLAIYGPQRPERSGVADYIELLLEGLRDSFRCFHVSNRSWHPPHRFDRVLYNVGNFPLYDCAFRALRLRPGPIILHEYNNLYYYYSCWSTLPRTEQEYLLRMLSRVCGIEFDVFESFQRWADANPSVDRYSLPAACEKIVVEQASLVIVHSAEVAKHLQLSYKESAFHVVTQAVAPIDFHDVDQTRSKVGLTSQHFVFGSYGFISPYKRVDSILSAWFAWRDRPAECRLLIAGARHYALQIPEDDSVKYVDFVPDIELFDKLLVACDAGIQLRFPSLGETSATINKLLAHGRPVITSTTYPDPGFRGCMIRVAPDVGEVEALVAAMKHVFQHGRQKRRFESYFQTAGMIKKLREILEPAQSMELHRG